MQHVFLCSAKGRDGQWEAICLDLDIAVQGESFPQIFDDLNEAIQEYVAYVGTLPEADRRRLLSRRAPWHLRLRTFARLIAGLFQRGGDRDSYQAEFTVPVALPAGA